MERHNVEYLGYYMALRLLVKLESDMDQTKSWKWYRYIEAEKVLNACHFASTHKRRMVLKAIRQALHN